MRVWTKNTICWKFWENFHKIIAKNALYLHTFQNKINKPCVNFLLTFGPKTQLIGKFWENFESFNENFIEKWKFYFIFRKFVTKNRAFGSNTIFLQQFFRFRGGVGFPSSPWLLPCLWWTSISPSHPWLLPDPSDTYLLIFKFEIFKTRNSFGC